MKNNKGKTVAYIRVSSVGQNYSRQLEALEGYDIDKVFKEKASASDTDRPALQEMLTWVRENDTVIIHSFDRISRSTKDLLEIVEQLEEKQVQLISLKENVDTKTPMGKFMLTMIGAIAELELANIRERQAEGIASAVKEGKFKGSEPIKIDDYFIVQYEKYKSRRIKTKRELAETLDISRPTLNKLINEYEEEYSQ